MQCPMPAWHLPGDCSFGRKLFIDSVLLHHILRITFAPHSRSLSLEKNPAMKTATLMAMSTSVPRLLGPPNSLAPFDEDEARVGDLRIAA